MALVKSTRYVKLAAVCVMVSFCCVFWIYRDCTYGTTSLADVWVNLSGGLACPLWRSNHGLGGFWSPLPVSVLIHNLHILPDIRVHTTWSWVKILWVWWEWCPVCTDIFVSFHPWNCWGLCWEIDVSPPLFTQLQPEMPTNGAISGQCDWSLREGFPASVQTTVDVLVGSM